MTPASTQYPRANDASSPEQGAAREPRLTSANEHRHDHMQGHGHGHDPVRGHSQSDNPVHSHGHSHSHDHAHDPVHSHGHGHSDRQVSARIRLSPVLSSVWARLVVALALSGLLWLAVAWALLNDV